jgi:hypothetical protein
MVNTNKILTVSYGTFSCTLEGFDDSFGTMKAIAEYFRDLASDDRYFGAEPPTPDAEMLTRIAEREIARRVQAQIEDNKIHLRADPGAALPAAAAAASAEAAPAQHTQTTPAEETTEATPTAEQTAPEVPTETAAPVSPAPEVSETPVEAALAPIESPAAEQPVHMEDDAAEAREEIAPAAEEVETAAETSPVADEPIETKEESAAEAAEDVAPTAEEAETAPIAEKAIEIEAVSLVEEVETEQASDAAEAQQATAPVEIAEETPVESAPQPAIDPDSVAAKLQRIRAVVEQAEDSDSDGFFTEDEYAEEYLEDVNEDIEAALEIDDEAEAARTEQPEDAAEDEHDDIAALLQRYGSAADAVADKDVEDDTADSEIESAEQAEEPAPEPEPDFVAETIEPAAEADLAEPAADSAESAAPADSPVRARIIKMKRTDFEAAIAGGSLVAADDEEEIDPNALSPDDENDLLRELAAVEAELNASDAHAEEDLADEDADDDSADNAAMAYEDEEDDIFAELDADDDDSASEDSKDDSKSAGASLFAAEGNEDEMSRIFAEANTQLDEEGGKGRRNAIAHLRAAVAATRAEAGGGKPHSDNPDAEMYRDDLASVVRPRRPEVAKPNTRRPDARRAAPLKLVAEQRVDLDDTKSTPIRPRRVSTPAAELPANQTGAGDFAEYAESVGANALPELLEAAASYLSFVEGREQFSRPQLMTQVRQAEKDKFSREDGLRSFGQLLREGKIEKLEGGRFKASASISYRPDQRYAGE